jgi:hypothetical protein
MSRAMPCKFLNCLIYGTHVYLGQNKVYSPNREECYLAVRTQLPVIYITKQLV